MKAQFRATISRLRRWRQDARLPFRASLRAGWALALPQFCLGQLAHRAANLPMLTQLRTEMYLVSGALVVTTREDSHP